MTKREREEALFNIVQEVHDETLDFLHWLTEAQWAIAEGRNVPSRLATHNKRLPVAFSKTLVKEGAKLAVETVRRRGGDHGK